MKTKKIEYFISQGIGDGKHKTIELKKVKGEYACINELHCATHKETTDLGFGKIMDWTVTHLETGYMLGFDYSREGAIELVRKKINVNQSKLPKLFKKAIANLKKHNIPYPVNKLPL